MKNVVDIVDAVSGDLGSVANGDAVVGSPLKLGSVTVYPISLVSVGFGGGGGQGENSKSDEVKKGPCSGSGSGGGAGGGAKARPVAVIVVSPEGVSVLPVPHKKGALDRLLEKIPQLVERFTEKGEAKA